MRRKILSLLTAVFMMFTVVGCNKEGLSLLNDMKTVAAWDATDMKGNVTVQVKVGEEKVTGVADYTAYACKKGLQNQIGITFKQLTTTQGNLDLTKEGLSNIKVYTDGGKFYVSSSYVKALAKMLNINLTGKVDTTKEFVALDLTDAVKASGMDLNNMQKTVAQSYDLMENSKVEIPTTQDDNKYIVEMDSDQLVASYIAFAKETMVSDLAKEQYQAMGLTEAQIKAQTSEAAASLDQVETALKAALKGSTAKVTYSFDKDAYDFTIDLQLKLNVSGEVIEMSVKETAEVTKATSKEVIFPTSVATYTLEDLMAKEPITVNEAETFKKEGVTYAPFRKIMEQAGYEVKFDAKTKKTYIVVDGEKEEVSTFLNKGVAYVALDNLGFEVEVTK